MRNKGRITALLAAAGLFLTGLQSLPVFASENGESSDGKWYLREYEDGTVSVACMDPEITEADIPAKIDGKTITMIEVDGFKDCTALRKVTVPDTVTVIEDYAFYSCSALEEINVPKNVKNIGFQAFYGCAALREIKIPASVTDIEAFAFEGCSSLMGVTVAESNPAYRDENGVLFDRAGETLYLYPSANENEQYTVPEGCTEIYDYAFIGNPYLKHVDISGIASLGEDAFYYCTALETLEIPDAVTELKGSVCGNCTALQSVRLPANLKSIGESCFYNCLQLSGLEIPETVQSIGNYAFFNCPGLTRIRLTRTTSSIGDYALGWYMGENEQPVRLPDFEVDAEDNTAAFDYCVKNSIRCTGGVTQGTVFLYIILGVVALVIIITVVIIIVQKKIQKRYELN